MPCVWRRLDCLRNSLCLAAASAVRRLRAPCMSSQHQATPFVLRQGLRQAGTALTSECTAAFQTAAASAACQGAPVLTPGAGCCAAWAALGNECLAQVTAAFAASTDAVNKAKL